VSAQDYRINAVVRRHLVSRWVDVNRLQLGTTNGVVYVIGTLETTQEDPSRANNEHRDHDDRLCHLVLRLEKELRRLPDVRDLVFKLENLSKRSGRWRSNVEKALD
jgi:hypothetical protein